jgi:hypothetical protein
MRALGFDERQRSDNRAGHFGGSQRVRALGWDTLLYALATLGLLAWTANLLTGSPVDKHGVPLSLASRGVGALFSAAFGAGLGWLALERIRDAIDGRVVSVVGEVTLHVISGKSTTYEWHVAGEQLEISSRVANLQVAGRRYCVWYLPRSKRVMSAEDLGRAYLADAAVTAVAAPWAGAEPVANPDAMRRAGVIGSVASKAVGAVMLGLVVVGFGGGLYEMSGRLAEGRPEVIFGFTITAAIALAMALGVSVLFFARPIDGQLTPFGERLARASRLLFAALFFGLAIAVPAFAWTFLPGLGPAEMAVSAAGGLPFVGMGLVVVFAGRTRKTGS